MDNNKSEKESTIVNQKNLHVSEHPLVAAKMSILRNKATETMVFRELTNELALLLGYEATKDLPIKQVGTANSDLGTFTVDALSDSVALVPIMRAGLGLLTSMATLLPTAPVFHMGIFRERDNLQPVEYYNKLPSQCHHPVCIVLDAMLATGGTAIATVRALKEWGAKRIKIVTLCASAKGVQRLQAAHPDVQIYTAAVDEELSEDGYIVPGLGDAGDRLYRTK